MNERMNVKSDRWVYEKPLRNWRRILKHRRQRARRGFSDYDVWNLDGYLAQMIADTVAHLRAHGHGYPGNLSNEAEWDAILKRIEVPLRSWAEHKHDMDPDEEDRWMERCRDALELFREYFFTLWD